MSRVHRVTKELPGSGDALHLPIEPTSSIKQNLVCFAARLTVAAAPDLRGEGDDLLMPTIVNRRRATPSAVSVSALALVLVTGALWPHLSWAGDLNQPAQDAPIIAVDWQAPLSLPPRFRNHCRYDINHGAWYCSDHCGIDDQFYFCSPASFGCCHPGYGYCDWRRHLRCAP
jgi:hypothetical protein